MDDFEYGKPILSFMTVGVLRELLKDYSDNTPIYVCGAPGVFFPNNEQQYILLDTMDSGGYEVIGENDGYRRPGNAELSNIVV